MKKAFLVVSIVAIILMSVVNVQAYAYDEELEEEYYAESLAVLAFRDANGEFLANLPKGEIFTVLKTDPRDSSRAWIQWNGRQGSVIKSCIERTDKIPNDRLSEHILNCFIAKCALNLRRPENYEFIVTIPSGSIIDVTGIDEYNEGRVTIKWNGYEGSVVESGLIQIASSSCILIDIENQYVRMYNNGLIICEGNCVTGMKDSRDTPKGVYSIGSMTTNATLKGSDYEVKVTYWMPFCNGCGLHDATWRSSFGGSIYEYDGSHGCVNMPYDLAKTIYENAYVGMMVVVY